MDLVNILRVLELGVIEPPATLKLSNTNDEITVLTRSSSFMNEFQGRREEWGIGSGPLKGLVYICGIWVGGMSETIVTGLHLSYSDLVNFIA